MSTSEPKKDEAPASEAVAEPARPETASKDEPTAAERKAADTRAADTEAADTKAADTKAEAKPETGIEAQPAAAADQTAADEPVWPPPESQPEAPAAASAGDPAPPADPDGPALLAKTDEETIVAKTDEPTVLTKTDEPTVLTKTDEPAPAAKHDDPAGKPDEPAAEPSQEMGLSESTLHWLVDGEQAIEPSERNPVLAPIYDARAPVAGRKRTFAIIGGAAILSLGIAWALHAQAARHQTTAAATTVDSADLLTHRAEAALAQGRGTEALDLARLAIVTDARLADAYIVIGTVQRSNGQTIDARDSYRHYLELAPIGTHAAEARAALTSLPP
jgi:hypothetical protein